MMAGVQGYASQLGIGSVSASVMYPFVSCNGGVDETYIDANGIRGTRQRDISHVRAGNRSIHYSITLEPTALELSTILPFVFGGTAYFLTETLASFFMEVDKVAKVMSYSNCVVNWAEISGSQGEPLRLTLDITGQDETIGAAGSFPALTPDSGTKPFIFTDLAILASSSITLARDVRIRIDNVTDQHRFFNSRTINGAPLPQDRHVTLNTNVPYGDAFALYNSGGSVSTSMSASFTDGGSILTFVAGQAAGPRRPIDVPGRTEIMMPLQFELYSNVAGSVTSALTTTLAVGP